MISSIQKLLQEINRQLHQYKKCLMVVCYACFILLVALGIEIASNYKISHAQVGSLHKVDTSLKAVDLNNDPDLERIFKESSKEYIALYFEQFSSYTELPKEESTIFVYNETSILDKSSEEMSELIESFSVEDKENNYKLSNEELKILYRIVEAEATGEDVKGKILVANVILNRVKDDEFPDSVKEVVFQKSNGIYQFSPIKDKRYFEVSITDETKEAVIRALCGEDYSEGALYFMSRKRTKKAKWFDNNLKRLFEHGCHEFFTDRD